MASPSERHRNNVRAGIFVSVSLLLGLAILVVLTDAVEAISRGTERYTVVFDVASGVSNLKAGSDVRVGGVPMGRVTDIRPQLKEGEAFREIAVDFTLDRRIAIYRDAIILISSPLIGADAWLDIPNVGEPAAGRAAGSQPLRGTPSVGVLAHLLGPENAAKADEMVENAKVFSGFLARMPDEYDHRVASILEDWGVMTSDMRALVADVRERDWPVWSESMHRVMTWAADATSKFDAAIADGHGLLLDGREVIRENREPIRTAVGNVQQATERINTETLEKLHRVLESGQQGVEAAVAVLEDMRVDYSGWATNIGEALANANLTAQQLKLAAIETRRSPWKLLYRPSATELEHELLYEATRSFAVAAADLKASSEAVRRVLENHSSAVAHNEEAYRRLEQSLLKSLDNYEKAQQQLLDVLIADQAGR